MTAEWNRESHHRSGNDARVRVGIIVATLVLLTSLTVPLWVGARDAGAGAANASPIESNERLRFDAGDRDWFFDRDL